MSDTTRPKKKWVPPSSGISGLVENGVLEKIGVLLKDESVEEISQFLSKGFGSQAIQSWSYFAQVNDHRKFTSSTVTITKLLGFMSGHNELHEYSIQMIKDILTNYVKTIYRGLNSMRASLTNPILRLINEIVLFRNGALVDDFVALFDFTLPVLPKLLVPSKTELADIEGTKEKDFLSIRHCFIRLLLNLLKYSAPLLRKDLLINNSKIMINWFKYICVIDSNNLINLTLTVWDEKIIKEQSFKKATKVKVFNEWNISKILPVYYTKDKELRTTFDKFILSLATDSKYGLRFNTDETWFLPSSGSGTISVNGKSFKTHNKLLYSLVTNLKPWDDDLQLHATIEILKSTPELIPPFVNYLASRGLHDPKLSSYWLGQTLLLSKIISLEIPEDIVSHDSLPSPATAIVAELIVPSVLNRSVLARCLLSESFLIRQLSSQLIINSIQKLEKLLGLYTQKDWTEQRIQLINKVRLSLPELPTVLNSLTDSYTKKPENKILLLSLLTTVNGYMRLFSESLTFSQHLAKPYSEIINAKEFKSIDFVLLDNFFQLQEGDSSNIKWWNKSDKSTSLFTSLLKLGCSKNSVSDAVTAKITKLLSNLVRQTVIFNSDNAKADQIELLVHSLQKITLSDENDEKQTEKIWKLLDESVSRCVRSPFKYLDSSNQLHRISPLIITIFEQWKFVDKSTKYDLTTKWLAIFLRYLVIAGEPLTAILELLKTAELSFDISSFLPSTTYEKSLDVLEKDEIMKTTNESSFFEIITTAPLQKLLKLSKIPTSHLDIVGSLFRLTQIYYDDSLKLKERGLEAVLVDILSKVGNYVVGNPQASIEFSNQKYWNDLFVYNNEDDKRSFISSTLAEIFSQLPEFDSNDFKKITKQLLEADSGVTELVLGASIWALDDNDLLALVGKKGDFVDQEALNLLLERKVPLRSEIAANILQKNNLKHFIGLFISRKLVIYDEPETLFAACAKVQSAHSTLRLLAKEESVANLLLEFIVKAQDPSLTVSVASSLPQVTVKEFNDQEQLSSLVTEAKQYVVNSIKEQKFDSVPFLQLLHIFFLPLINAEDDEKDIVLNYALGTNTNKYTYEVANLIEAFDSFSNSSVKLWMNKSILYMTKVLAEFEELPSTFTSFLGSFKSLLMKVSLAQVTNKAHLNSLLEVIFTKWPTHETVLEFGAALIVVGSKSSLETNKLLQILISNDDMALIKRNKTSSRAKFLTALIIWRLFEFDVSKNSNITLQEKILSSYNGTNNAEDILLYKVLEKLETRLNSSWIDYVYTWDFLDTLTEDEADLIGETKFIEKKKEGFVITLNKSTITNTIKEYSVHTYEAPTLQSGGHSNWMKIEEFYEEVKLSTPKKETYNPFFLSLLVINNDELVTIAADDEEQSPKVNVRKLMDSNLFAFLLLNLSSTNEQLTTITQSILSAILISLKTNSSFKDKHIIELFLTKILFTFRKIDEDSGERLKPAAFSPLVYSMISRMSSILVNPGHVLYEKAFRWVLKSPVLRQNEIPLYNEITTVTVTNDDSSNYYKQLSWLLECFVEGVKTKEDVKLLRNKNVFELIMNLSSSPFISNNIKFLVLAFIHKVQEVEEGADMLITRYGGLANLEQHISSLEFNGDLLTSATEIAKTQQELLNLKELGIRYSVIGQARKRIENWTQDGLPDFTKRLKTSHK